MDMSELWWNQVGCGNNLVKAIVDEVSSENSVFLTNCDILPWKDGFYEIIIERISKNNAVRSFEQLDYISGDNPGKSLLESLFSNKIQSSYWLGESYEHYLANIDFSVLGQRFIIVHGLKSPDDISAWYDFIRKYEKEVDFSCKEENKAVFIVEVPCELITNDFKSVRTIPYIQLEIDIFLFCVIYASQMNLSYNQSRYIAELITLCSEGNAEIAGKLLDAGQIIFDDPERIINGVFSDEGFVPNNTVENNEFMAQLKHIFPQLELQRREIIVKHFKKICSVLPWKDDYGHLKDDPYDLELRDLQFLSGKIGLSADEKKNVEFLKELRNQLAHNNIITPSQLYLLF